MKTRNKTTTIIYLLVLIIITYSTLSLNFTQNPQINSGTGTSYTTEDLICNWTSSPDTTNTIINWYNGTQLILTENPATNPSTLNSANTTKGEIWHCNITIQNSTHETNQSASTTIINSLPLVPTLYNSTNQNQGSTILVYEDNTYGLFINSTDPDNDQITYAHAGTICGISTTFDYTNGNFTCTPTNDDLTSPESPYSKFISFFAEDNSPGEGEYLRVNFTVIPQNDQANFSTLPSPIITINADTTWEYTLIGTDEETNTPYNFTLSSDLNNAFPNLINIHNTSQTQSKINFSTQNGAPTNAHVGNWTIQINITDNYGWNATVPPTTYTFQLIINRTNHYPEIITNASIQNGTQGLLYTNTLYGNDTDTENNLTWSITPLTNATQLCQNNWPWTIETKNNSAINSTALINMTLNNTHIACRTVNITLQDDDSGSTSQIYTLNLTNTNDPPELHEESESGNITHLNVHLYSTVQYKINATDIDSYTYDAENTANLTYTSNDTTFLTINNETNTITINPTNESYVGNWSFNITVTDNEYNSSRIMNITVINNTAPEITINQTNYTFNQSDTIEIYFNILERNNESINITIESHTEFNSTIYNITTITNNYSNYMNNQTSLINMTQTTNRLANDQVGFHNITINTYDELNSSRPNISTAIITMQILNENDYPIFDQNKDNISDTLTMGTIVKNIIHTKNINVTDYDLLLNSTYANETLSMTYNETSENFDLINITKTGQDSFELKFKANTTGTQWLNLILTDSNNASTQQNISFTVLDSSTPPIIHYIKPYYNETLNETLNNFTNATIYQTKHMNLTIPENTTLIYDAIIENDTTILNNNLTYAWYINGQLNKTITNTTQNTNTNLTIEYDFWSSGLYNITLIAEDIRYSTTNFTWQINVTNINRPPQYNHDTLEDLSVNYSSEFVNYMNYRNLTQRFYDPDDDIFPQTPDGKIRSEDNETSQLTYSVMNPELCSLATFSFTQDTLRVTPTETGSCVIVFNATDPYGESVLSDQVTMTVIGATPETGTSSGASSGGSRTNTRVITVPIEEEVETPKPIKIIAPANVDTYANKTIHIPIKILNTWEEEIKGVYINASMALQNNITYKFDKTYFNIITPGSQVETDLSITNYRTDGPFEITIYASVQEPNFVDSTTILINSMEQTNEGKEIEAKVTFARDMLSENPECRELTDLLERADRALKSLDYEQSLNLVNGVINGCKFLINEEKIMRRETPSIIDKSFDFIGTNAEKLVIGSGVLLILTIAFYVVAAFRKIITEQK
ncbi:hypothetical protein K9L97_03645 [Candidatus Woesearchaeota archaeon]|nr:hypothetical protein [Candidatus Woesearchaeota archaeon]